MQNNIFISDSFLESIDNLSKKFRKQVRSKISEFASNSINNSFSLHSLDRTDCDESFKSIRINKDLRVILAQQGDKYILLYVDHHDDAYKWAKGKYLYKNSYGALYVKDNIKIRETTEKINAREIQEKYDTRPSLLEKAGVKISELIKLGIDKDIANDLVKIKDENQFLEIINVMPEELAEGLLDIITGNKPYSQVYYELQDNSISDSANLGEALFHKNSKRRFYFVEDQDELKYIFNKGADKWKLFLHPEQENIVKMNFNGPALIEGGPGTGKTVVGLHRAIYLSKNIYSSQKNKILFCTFSKKLAKYIHKKLEQLQEQKSSPDNIEVQGVDSLITKLVFKNNLTHKKLDVFLLKKLMEEAYLELDWEENFGFYETEYYEVIQRNYIRSLEEYLQVNRLGRKKSIEPETRKKHWKFFELLLRKKEENKIIDFEDMAFILNSALEKGIVRPIYDSIIIDEAQDLSPIKLRVLKNLVKSKRNNLLLLSDKNQRIYRLNSWKQETGLNVVGRTYYLTVNYRTTKQIREYADKQFIKTKLSSVYLKEYKSIYIGPKPIEKEFNNRTQQYRFIINTIKNYLNNGIEPHEIVIISPIEKKEIGGALKYEGIRYSYLSGDTYPEPGKGIGISSLHGAKGLEFKVVFLANFNQIEEKMINGIENKWYNKQKIRQIECLKYVSCTRARDELIITTVSKK